MRYLTDFADQAVILPLVFATAIALALQGWRRGGIGAWRRFPDGCRDELRLRKLRDIEPVAAGQRLIALGIARRGTPEVDQAAMCEVSG